MPYGYVTKQPNQIVNNSGVFSTDDVLTLIDNGTLGGSLELIEEQTVSGATVMDFTSIQETVYDVHLLQISGIQHTGANSTTRLRFYESGVLETASVYQYAFLQGESNGNFYDTLRSTGFDSIWVSYSNNGTGTGDLETAYIYFYNLGNSAKYSFLTMHSIFQDVGIFKLQFGGGVLPQASTVDGIRLDFQSTATDGSAKLYGVKQL